MQAIREKPKAKAELKEEEKAETEMAKQRLGVVHKIRLAKAEMNLHANKANKGKVAARYDGADDPIAYLQP